MLDKLMGLLQRRRPGPTIACINNAATPLGVDFGALIVALQRYVDHHLLPAWGTSATLVASKTHIPGAWGFVFLDDADQPGALAYHDLTPEGLPESKVFVRTTLRDGALVSVSASHELAEMLVDPATNLLCTGPDAAVAYAYEVADPVEETDFPINGIRMSNFVTPEYFEGFHKPGSVPFDQLGLVHAPFELLTGGYQSIFKGGRWTEVFGSEKKAQRFAREDRRGHRSESRKARA